MLTKNERCHRFPFPKQLINVGNFRLGRCGLLVELTSQFDQIGQVLRGEKLAVDQWQCAGFTNLLEAFGVKGFELLFVDTVKPLDSFFSVFGFKLGQPGFDQITPLQGGGDFLDQMKTFVKMTQKVKHPSARYPAHRQLREKVHLRFLERTHSPHQYVVRVDHFQFG